LGWNIGVSNFIFGGRRGYSGGKESVARKKPPEEDEGVSKGEEECFRVPKKSSLTAIKPAIIVDHKHDLPFKYVPVGHSATDTGDVFVSLHLFQLTSKQATGCRGRHGRLLQIGQSVGIGGQRVDIR
jgi:hypothetical protein